jgi:hypothetical protein
MMPKFYRQNRKKINPRYFLNETTNRDLLSELDPSLFRMTGGPEPAIGTPGKPVPSEEDIDSFLSSLGTAVEVVDAVFTVAAIASGAGAVVVVGKEIAEQGLKQTVKSGIKKYGKKRYKEKLKKEIKKKKEMDIKFRPPRTNVKPKDIGQEELFKAQVKRNRGEVLSDREKDILDILDWNPRSLRNLETGVHLGAEVGIKSVHWHARNNPLFKHMSPQDAEDAAREWIKAQIKLRKQFPETFK